jgi:anti-sigma factor ChrR (cupin superfamily)
MKGQLTYQRTDQPWQVCLVRLPGQVCLDRTDGTDQQVQPAWQIRLDMSARTVQQGKVSWVRSGGRVKPVKARLDRTTWTGLLRQDRGEKSAGTDQPTGQVSLERTAGKGHQGRSA